MIVEPLRAPQHPTVYTDEHRHVRQFLAEKSRTTMRASSIRAA
jgi:hypothetical protein